MKRKVSRLRPSPNEEARLIREEVERRRKLRIQQVREQQRGIALQIRRGVEQRRQHELRQLEEQLRRDWERKQKEKLQTLQRLYQESLQLLGESHRRAKENEPDLAAVAQREEEHHARAEERYRQALKELKTHKLKEQERQRQSINARKKALQAEKERSAKMAGLPPPPPNPSQGIDPKKPHVVKRSDLSAFAATRYHMPDSTVEKEPENVQPDAREEADLEARRLQDLQWEEKRRREEQLEKARLRGRQALRREQLVQDRERFLAELEHMQQTDLLRRRQQVSQMPPQIFQPLYRRQETREDFQREMEFAFEDMYTGERRVKGDLVVQLVPEPLPASSSTGQDLDQDLDVTLDDNSKPETENIQDVSEDGAGSAEQETSAEGEAVRPPPRRALRKLLDRIRNQRNDWINGSSGGIPEGDSPTAFTDLIPERDTTIETGSLTKETDRRTPTDLCHPLIPPPAVGPTEPQPEGDGPLPDVLRRIQEVEEERRRREAELEVEKQQQIVLLQELEEQKARLEEMLEEARQERENLKAAVTQEALLLHPQAPVQNRVPTGLTSEVGAGVSGGVGGAACRLDEDESTRRVREYQQRLLDQNRVHQRSVEVARQRLEEYQRALRIRHNLQHPPVHRPGLVPPFPAPPQVPAPSDDVAACGSDDSVTNPFSSQRPDDAAQLADSILERVTKHLPDRLRPSAVPAEPYTPTPPPGSTYTTAPSDPTRAAGPDSVPLDPGPRAGPPISRQEDLDWRRRELQEVQRRVVEQRQQVALRETLQEEERRRTEAELEQIRRQKETLQALMDTDEGRVSDAPGEGLDSEDNRQRRLELLSSLLKAIEESNGGTLSHLEDLEEEEGRQTQPDQGVTAPEPSGLPHPPRTLRPPVTRVRLGFKEMLPEPHELSAIQEVETPVNMSRVTEDNVSSHPTDLNLLDGSGSPAPSDRTLQSLSSSGPNSAKRRVGSETSSCPPWRERLLSGAGTPPEPSASDSSMKGISPPGSDSGRGADLSGPAVLSCPSPAEPLHRPAQSDHLSSTSISSGSYVSTDPEPRANVVDEPQSGSGSDGVPSPSAQTLGAKVNPAPSPPGLSVDSLFGDSGVQRIIDRYTRELNLSLRSAGTAATDGEAPSLEESSSSVSQQTLVGPSGMRMEDEDSAGHQGVHLDAAATQHMLETMDPDRPAPADSSLIVDPEQDSFRPLRFQLADQSSCLGPEERHSVLEQLVGQPSAHSSMIRPQPRTPAAPGSVASGWDSTLSRMIGRLSRQSGSGWLSPGQDFCAGGLSFGPSWLEGFQEESQMRALVGQLDGSAGRSGERRPAAHGVFTGSREAAQPLSLPEASAHGPHPGLPDQNQPGVVELDSHRAEDSFHPLLPEITHNETADPSMTFHLPEHNMSDSSDTNPPGVSPPSEEDDPPPEQLRAEEPSGCRVLQESFSQLLITEAGPQESLLALSPAPRTSFLADLPTCGAAAVLSASEGGASRVAVSGPEEENQQDSSSSEAAEGRGLLEGRGILEESQITLVSLTDTTLQDQETVTTDDEGLHDNRAPGSLQDGQGAEATLLPEEGCQKLPASILQFQWSPSGALQDVFQQKRQALIQRSNRRVERIKAKRSSLVPTREKGPIRAKPVRSEPQNQTEAEVKGGRTAQQRHLLGQAPTSSLKVPDGVRISAPEQRKQNLSEMHKRTQRLYEQLEEVKQQRAVRSRQDESARNRLKAKEFHRKTLQKLRAKQTRQ